MEIKRRGENNLIQQMEEYLLEFLSATNVFEMSSLWVLPKKKFFPSGG